MCVKFWDGRTLYLRKKTVEAQGLSRGMSLSDEQVKELRNSEGYSAQEAAAFTLGRRQLSRKELEDKLLEKSYAQDDVDEALDKMTELGFIDDEQYSFDVVEMAISKCLSKRGAKHELYKRGIDKELMENALENYPAEADLVTKTVKEKFPQSGERTQKERTKIQNYFLRRGFGYSEIRQGLQQADENE